MSVVVHQLSHIFNFLNITEPIWPYLSWSMCRETGSWYSWHESHDPCLLSSFFCCRKYKNDAAVEISTFEHVTEHITNICIIVKLNIGCFTKIINYMIHGFGRGFFFHVVKMGLLKKYSHLDIFCFASSRQNDFAVLKSKNA